MYSCVYQMYTCCILQYEIIIIIINSRITRVRIDVIFYFYFFSLVQNVNTFLRISPKKVIQLIFGQERGGELTYMSGGFGLASPAPGPKYPSTRDRSNA